MATQIDARNKLSLIAQMKIEKVETELYHVPLSRPMEDAIHGFQENFSLVVVKITTDDGATGMGYTYSVGQVGGTAIATLIRDNLAPLSMAEMPKTAIPLRPTPTSRTSVESPRL